MTRTVVAPPGFTLGDGSTASQVAATRWAAWRWYASIGALALVTLITMSFMQAPTSTRDLSMYNHQPNGARALVNILGDQGVNVREVATLDAAHSVVRDGGTLVIADYEFLSVQQIDTIRAHPGDVVWLYAGANELTDIHPQFGRGFAPDSNVVSAGCDVPAALAAQSLTDVRGRISVSGQDPALTMCFSGNEGASGAYVGVDRPGNTPMHVLADSTVASNARLDVDGHAALALWLTGTHSTVAWYVAESGDQTLLSDDQPGGSYFTPTTPSWMDPLIVALVLTGFAAAVWRGRRMGALVTEPLPAVVRASEATRGRARLYRQGRARGHASAALRAGAATRMAARLGLPRSSSADEVVAAISAATGRDGAQVSGLLYGRAPTTDDQMIDLVSQLDTLEGEVASS